jgi:hypothetical protein
MMQHGDGIYAVLLLPAGGKWSAVGFVTVKNLDQSGAPDCDTGEWLLSEQAMKVINPLFEACLPLPQKVSVRLDFLEDSPDEGARREAMTKFIGSEVGAPLAREEFKKFRVVSFRTRL